MDISRKTPIGYRDIIRAGGFLAPSNHPYVTPMCYGRNGKNILVGKVKSAQRGGK